MTFVLMSAVLVAQCKPGQACYRGSGGANWVQSPMVWEPAPQIVYPQIVQPAAAPPQQTVEGSDAYRILALENKVKAIEAKIAKCPCTRGEEPSTKSAAAAEAPASKAEPVGQLPNYGIDVKKLNAASEPGKYAYSLNGKKASAQQAFEAFGDGLTDDSANLRLTCVGDDAYCKKVATDVAGPTFADLAGQFHFQAYKPDDAMVKDLGLPAGNHVYLQQPDGKVLARFDDDYQPESAAQELRKRRPNYDPAKDPKPGGGGLKLPALPIRIDWPKVPTWAYVVGGVVLLRLLGGNTQK